MKAKYARLIRIGINARCVPYTSVDDVHGGVGLDYKRMRANSLARERAQSTLTERAYWRTRPWMSRRLGAR